MKLPQEFYLEKDVVALAKRLIGKRIVTKIDRVLTSGIITETEAYAGAVDRASHAYGGRLTARTKTMFERGGISYVYLCYGIHHLFNFVTNQEGIPHAILLRGIHPEKGIPHMLERRNKLKVDKTLSAGPGTASQALGITTALNGISLSGNKIWVEETGIVVPDEKIHVGPRIGVDYAKEDAKLPYRFLVSGRELEKFYHGDTASRRKTL
ncbi:MAG TPA: DNA-3-methyladenine glycosylase [Bacteroidia bacterium]|nr:DNA-3-methyladenine glycosylase [Bacteroidia bacterium]